MRVHSISLCAYTPAIVWPTSSSRVVERPLPAGGPIQADGIEPVAPQLDADGALRVTFEEMAEPPVGHATAGSDPTLGLLELIAVVRIVEEVGEVGEQVQAVVKHEAGGSKRRRAVRALELGGELWRLALPPSVGSSSPNRGDHAAVDRTLRHLVGRVPVRPEYPMPVSENPLRLSPRLYRTTPLSFLVVVRPHPRSVVVIHLERAEQVAAADARRRRAEHASPSVVAAAHAHDRTIELIRRS